MPPSTVLSWPVLGTVAAGVGTIFLVRYLLRYREKPGAKLFVLTLVGQATFCFAYGIGLAVFTPDVRFWLEVLALVGLHWTGVPFLGFALAYTGRGKLLHSWSYRSLYVIPLGVTLLLPLNPWHGLFWTDFRIASVFDVATVAYTFEPLLYVTVLAGLVPAGIGALLLVDTVLNYGPLYRTEALAVGLSPWPPTLGLFAWLFGFGPVPQFNATSVLLGVHVLLDAYAFVGSGMFEFHPATNRAAERSAIDDLRSPVLVLDVNGRVVEYNDPVENLLDVDDAITRHVSSVVGADIDVEQADRHLSLRPDGKQLEFRVESAPLTDSGGNHVGYTLLFQDVTEEIQREQRLSVLNRVLRHNLRNDLSVVKSYVQEARERSEDDAVVRMLRKADGATEELTSTGETAREIEQTIGSADAYRETTTVGTALEPVVDSVSSQYPAASITFDGRDDVPVRTDVGVLRSVVEELLTNAVDHHDGEHPTVTLSVTATPETVTLTISDDGPGIPEHELQTLERGEETALEHGSGLGLWLVRWGVMRLGGDVSFAVGNGGTTVTLTLPGDGATPGGETATLDGPAGGPASGDETLRADGAGQD